MAGRAREGVHVSWCPMPAVHDQVTGTPPGLGTAPGPQSEHRGPQACGPKPGRALAPKLRRSEEARPRPRQPPAAQGSAVTAQADVTRVTQNHRRAPAAAARLGQSRRELRGKLRPPRETTTRPTPPPPHPGPGRRLTAPPPRPPPPISSAPGRGAGSKLPAAFPIGSYSRRARGLAAVQEGGRCPLAGRPLGKAAGEPLARWRASASGPGPEEGAIGWKVG